MMKRHNKKWSVNEVLALQREYELLEWDIIKIAKKHERSNRSVLFKLEKEGFIDNWETARGFKLCGLNKQSFNEIKSDTSFSENNSYIEMEKQTTNNHLLFRIETLEKTVFDFKIIITKLLNDTSLLKNQKKNQLFEL